jgi:nucleotide-binding universal stress UspA family protein
MTSVRQRFDFKTGHRFSFKTIVVATDLTHSGSCALQYAQRIAQLHRSKFVVEYVIDPAGYAFPEGMSESVASDQRTRDALRQIEDEISDQGIPTHSVVETGVIYDCILQAAIDHQADLLVLGTHATAKIGRAALGTVARRLLATAPCPILTVPPAANSNIASAGDWNNVLVATDFSDASLDALNRAQAIVRRQLIVLHVTDDPASSSHQRHLELLRFLAPFNESHTVPVEHVVAAGEAGEVIAEHADRLHADLVVLGSPIDERDDEEFETSTVLQVISNVSCPVLCVPFARDASMADVVNEFALSH